ncbi:hypothetical protein ACLIBG_10680 [Virgibacillus sp. W0181]|uniref:hypothetical protein n=1 Tax=Virgibacillus sp. W0181 TaxID=3391581 RepID=UPI003F48252A
MSKSEMMDQYLVSYEGTISTSVICQIVHMIFGINLDEIPILAKGNVVDAFPIPDDNVSARILIDSYLNQYDEEMTGAHIRWMINDIFGVNLDAISSLEGKRISLYSKEHWVVHHKKDLIVVHTGTGDDDVKVYPTTYLTEQIKSAEPPINFQEILSDLSDLGYIYDEEMGGYYYINPDGEAVSDRFKGKTMETIVKVIRKSFSHL